MAAIAERRQGRVVERDWKGGRGFALRFYVNGERQYVTLGSEAEGWTRKAADEELENVLADVRRGIWVAPKKKKARHMVEAETVEETLFGPFAEGLVARRRGEVSERQSEYDSWGLGHLLPYFGNWPLNEIDSEAVDDFRRSKLAESERRQKAIERRRPLRADSGQPLRPFAPTTINKMIGVLQLVLEVAREYGRVAGANAAVGRRRMKVPPKPAIYLESAAQIEALLEAAVELDRDHRRTLGDRLAVVSTLVFAGPRAIEIGYMQRRDADPANDRFFIGRSKTQAGLREVRMLPIVRDHVAAHLAASPNADPDDLLFANDAGNRRDKDSIRLLLKPVIARANALLAARGQRTLPKGLSPHKLRHTFASILIACGEDPAAVMAQLGHTDPHFTMRVYTHMMSRDPAERQRLKALVRGERVIAVPAPEPVPLDGAAYEGAILRALADRGGSATRAEVIAAVATKLADLHGPADLERLPSGRDVRWVQRLAKARLKMVRRGLMMRGSGRGRWELTANGAAKLVPPAPTVPAREREALAA
ncbi:MAG: tyrosine-type recombinase/integrase [Solirubrobacterales bacterium]|nr:tyrosine-type recombinase/integrase [Solirubrobacterales bacterium]